MGLRALIASGVDAQLAAARGAVGTGATRVAAAIEIPVALIRPRNRSVRGPGRAPLCVGAAESRLALAGAAGLPECADLGGRECPAVDLRLVDAALPSEAA